MPVRQKSGVETSWPGHYIAGMQAQAAIADGKGHFALEPIEVSGPIGGPHRLVARLIQAIGDVKHDTTLGIREKARLCRRSLTRIGRSDHVGGGCPKGSILA